MPIHATLILVSNNQRNGERQNKVGLEHSGKKEKIHDTQNLVVGTFELLSHQP